MSQERNLSRPPVQEAVIQFRFADVSLGREQLDALSRPYVDAGWKREDRHAFEAQIGPIGDQPVNITSSSNFEGYLLRAPELPHAIQFHTALVSTSISRPYTTWEDLEALAFHAFSEYVEAAGTVQVSQISVRFINRVPGFEGFSDFGQILERPPLSVDGLASARVRDFLRRHILDGLEGGYEATLTVGTVVPEEGDFTGGKPLVIDTDVVKNGPFPPLPSVLREELAVARRIKNSLFFGSLKEAIVERFS